MSFLIKRIQFGSIYPSHWHDQRKNFNNRELDPSVIHLPTGARFGYTKQKKSSDVADSNDILRCLSLIILIGQPLLVSFKMVSRTVTVIPRTCKQGYNKAKESWDGKRASYFLNSRGEKAPGHIALAFKVVSYIFYSFFIETVKIATLPLASFLVICSAFWGLLFPLDGRFAIAKVEDFWSVETNISTHLNYSAACFQPKDVADRINLYAFKPDYDPTTPKSSLLQLHQLLEQSKPYFSKQEHSDLCSRTQRIRQVVSEQLIIDQNLKEQLQFNKERFNKLSQKEQKVMRQAFLIQAIQPKLLELLEKISQYRKSLSAGKNVHSADIFQSLTEIENLQPLSLA